MKPSKGVILLMYSSGFKPFLVNILGNLSKIQKSNYDIRILASRHDVKALSSQFLEFPVSVQIDTSPAMDELFDKTTPSHAFASREFNLLMVEKVTYIKKNLSLYKHVIYSDLDVAWLKNPIPYLRQINKKYPIAFQSEAQSSSTPVLCFGFASFRSGILAKYFFGKILCLLRKSVKKGQILPDQVILNQLFETSPWFRLMVFILPEALFPNGLSYRLMTTNVDDGRLEQIPSPFIFHSNFMIGLPNKAYFLEKYANWVF